MPDKTTIEQWINCCLHEVKHPLTPWEKNFIESIADQFDRKGSLSEKQEAILERIYAEKTI